MPATWADSAETGLVGSSIDLGVGTQRRMSQRRVKDKEICRSGSVVEGQPWKVLDDVTGLTQSIVFIDIFFYSNMINRDLDIYQNISYSSERLLQRP
jgi:hypothetical protein